jgi:thiaminase/transcriptional activator TenA
LSFSEDIEKKALPVRQAILGHPFITGIGDGALPVEKFKHWVSQDYVYLIDYSRVLALASARAPDLETMGWFARLLDETLNTEMELHRGYCAEFGISREELEATRAAPTTVGYTSFLLSVAHQGSFEALVASLLPCQWGFWEVGERLAVQGEPKHAPLYCQWIQMYTSPEFAQLARTIREMADRLAERAGPDEVAAMGEAYVTSLRFEHRFWEMAYTLEDWTA